MAKLLSTLILFHLLFSSAWSSFIPNIDTVPSEPINKSVTADYTAEVDSFDAPKLSGVNSSVYDWWYFDAVAADLNTSLVIIFFTSTAQGFPLLAGVNSAVSVSVFATLPNGTERYFSVDASSAEIASGGFLGDGAAGLWAGANATFTGTPNLDAYEVSFDFTETYGIKGQLTLDSVAPAHYPCTTNLSPGQTLFVIPHLGWCNAVPDAAATGSFTFTSSDKEETYTLGANASGYHDKNWGDVPFKDAAKDWWWGRARLGPYSLVFFQGEDVKGDEFASAYVAEDGKILTSSCLSNSTSVNATTTDKGELKSLDVHISLGEGSKALEFVLVPKIVAANAPGVYGRWLATLSGGMVGGQQYENGVSVLERFYPPTTS